MTHFLPLKPKYLPLLLVGALSFSGSAAAESVYLKPGTWELTMKMTSDSGELEKRIKQMKQQLAAMPEQSRAMAEQMNPFSMFDGEPRMDCMTQQDIDDADFNFGDDPSCEHDITRDGKDSHISVTCPGSNTTGKIHVDNGEKYTGTVSMPSQFPGISGNLTMEMNGEFVKEGCSEELKSQ